MCCCLKGGLSVLSAPVACVSRYCVRMCCSRCCSKVMRKSADLLHAAAADACLSISAGGPSSQGNHTPCPTHLRAGSGSGLGACTDSTEHRHQPVLADLLPIAFSTGQPAGQIVDHWGWPVHARPVCTAVNAWQHWQPVACMHWPLAMVIVLMLEAF